MKNYLQKTQNATDFFFFLDIKHPLRDHPPAGTKGYKKQRVCHGSRWLNTEDEQSLTITLHTRFTKKEKEKHLVFVQDNN